MQLLIRTVSDAPNGPSGNLDSLRDGTGLRFPNGLREKLQMGMSEFGRRFRSIAQAWQFDETPFCGTASIPVIVCKFRVPRIHPR